MYKSPIEINTIADEIIKRKNETIENEVFEAIFRVGVNVDKEELIKALKYDRKQYHKGYVDGVREFVDRICENRELDDPVVMVVNAELKRMEGND